MIKVYQLSFPEENSAYQYYVWPPHARRACVGRRDAGGKRRRGALRASQKSAGDEVVPSGDHPRGLPHRSQGRDPWSASVHSGKRRKNGWRPPHPSGQKAHRRSGVVTNTPPKRTRAFLSKS